VTALNRIAHMRLYNQKIAVASLPNPGEAAAWMLAVQGQDFAGAKWSLALRTAGSTEAEVEAAFAGRTFLRTWVMRGTLHLVNAADIHWLLSLMAPRVIAMCARRYQELELDETTLKRSNDLLVKALEDNERADRKSLMAMLQDAGISTEGQRAPYILQRASVDRLIVQVAVIRNEPIYTRLPEAGPDVSLDREQGLAKLARRYFLSRGPATLQDFSWWTGLPMADARAGLAQIAGELVQEKIGNVDYWRAPGTPQAEPSSSIYLLPGFDEYLVGYKDRRAIMDVDMKVLAGKNGMISPTVIIDGHISGTWKRTFKKGQVEIAVTPFAPFSQGQKEGIAAAAGRFGEFLNMPVVLDFEGRE
jgi:hypothetical protein